MFGFLKLKSCSLTEQDRLLYRSHFCSACHAMTRFGGRVSSLLTNYDITFWLLLQSALDSGPLAALEKRPCTALPIQSVSVRPLDDRVSQTMAALNLILVGSKIADDEQDGERFKAAAGKALFGRKVAKAEEFLRSEEFELDRVYRLHIEQARAERTPSPSLESLSQPTAEALGAIFGTIAVLQNKPKLDPVLQDFGRSLGAFLYLWDALTDFESDRKKGDFNAISQVYGEEPFSGSVATTLSNLLYQMGQHLESMAMGPEGKLCFELLGSLGKQLREKFPEVTPKPWRSPRKRLAKAGFVRTQDCDCCCPGDACEVGCCECGSCCECNVCDCNPCDSHETCCEFSCCSPCDCCCGESSSSGCCGESATYDCCSGSGSSFTCCDLFCLQSICCDATNPHSQSHSESSQRQNVGLMERFRLAKEARNAKTEDRGSSTRQCPRCERAMIKLMVGQVEIDECRNCGGVWCDDKEIDELAKMIRLPHNLLNRYPTEEAPSTKLPGDRNCPVCRKELVVVPYLGVPIEMCRECHGFWMDHGVLRRVLNAKRSPKRLLTSHKKDWRCPYCEQVSAGGSDVCLSCGAPRPKSGFTGKLA
jgi:Zn-finger nucleic acid-binding protein